MPIDQTLARVDALLADGDVAGARRRLKDLARSAPHRLDVRERLAEAYRREGNRAQAGRWGYLADVVDAHEQAAFRRAYGKDPVAMMVALHWHAGEDEAATHVARERLAALRHEAEESAGVTLTWLDPRRPEPPPHDGVLSYVALLLLVALGIWVAVGVHSAL